MTSTHAPHRAGPILVTGALAGMLTLVGLVALGALTLGWLTSRAACASATSASDAGVALGPAGGGALVGASEYGGPGDPSSGVVGASGVDLLTHPDSYAELGGLSFQTATMMGGLPYMTPLRITLGRALGDRLQARLRLRRRSDRRQPAGHRPVVAVRGRDRDPV